MSSSAPIPTSEVVEPTSRKFSLTNTNYSAKYFDLMSSFSEQGQEIRPQSSKAKSIDWSSNTLEHQENILSNFPRQESLKTNTNSNQEIASFKSTQSLKHSYSLPSTDERRLILPVYKRKQSRTPRQQWDIIRLHIRLMAAFPNRKYDEGNLTEEQLKALEDDPLYYSVEDMLRPAEDRITVSDLYILRTAPTASPTVWTVIKAFYFILYVYHEKRVVEDDECYGDEVLESIWELFRLQTLKNDFSPSTILTTLQWHHTRELLSRGPAVLHVMHSIVTDRVFHRTFPDDLIPRLKTVVFHESRKRIFYPDILGIGSDSTVTELCRWVRHVVALVFAAKKGEVISSLPSSSKEKDAIKDTEKIRVKRSSISSSVGSGVGVAGYTRPLRKIAVNDTDGDRDRDINLKGGGDDDDQSKSRRRTRASMSSTITPQTQTQIHKQHRPSLNNITSKSTKRDGSSNTTTSSSTGIGTSSTRVLQTRASFGGRSSSSSTSSSIYISRTSPSKRPNGNAIGSVSGAVSVSVSKSLVTMTMDKVANAEAETETEIVDEEGIVGTSDSGYDSLSVIEAMAKAVTMFMTIPAAAAAVTQTEDPRHLDQQEHNQHDHPTAMKTTTATPASTATIKQERMSAATGGKRMSLSLSSSRKISNPDMNMNSLSTPTLLP
eukprot:gene82-101_t